MGFLYKVVAVVHLGEVRVVVAVDGHIASAAVFELLQHLLFDDVPAVDEEFGTLVYKMVDGRLGIVDLFMRIGEEPDFHAISSTGVRCLHLRHS